MNLVAPRLAVALLLLSACDQPRPPAVGTDVHPAPPDTNACVRAGGICSSGGRCDGAAKGLHPVGLGDELHHACGGGSTGATCCVPCEVPPDAPIDCCHGSDASIPLCIDGKLGCPPGATPVSPGGQCPSSGVADAGAPPAASKAGRPVKPNVKVKPVIAQPKDETEDPAQSGWWPPFEGEGFPAISTDGKKVAVIEHADYFGHTQTPGVRLVDVASGRSDFLSLVPPGKHARDMPALLKAVPACEAKAAAANNALAKLAWESLAEPADDDYATAEWTVDGLKITNERDDATGWPKKLTLLDAASSKVLVTKDVTGWTRSRIRCATPSLRLVGVSRARGVVVFSQQLGGTLHDCDSVVVPTDYRVVALPP